MVTSTNHSEPNYKMEDNHTSVADGGCRLSKAGQALPCEFPPCCTVVPPSCWMIFHPTKVVHEFFGDELILWQTAHVKPWAKFNLEKPGWKTLRNVGWPKIGGVAGMCSDPIRMRTMSQFWLSMPLPQLAFYVCVCVCWCANVDTYIYIYTSQPTCNLPTNQATNQLFIIAGYYPPSLPVLKPSSTITSSYPSWTIIITLR